MVELSLKSVNLWTRYVGRTGQTIVNYSRVCVDLYRYSLRVTNSSKHNAGVHMVNFGECLGVSKRLLREATRDLYATSVWLAQLVKALAAPTHVRSLCSGGPESIPGADKLDSGSHPSGVGKMRSN